MNTEEIEEATRGLRKLFTQSQLVIISDLLSTENSLNSDFSNERFVQDLEDLAFIFQKACED